MSRLTPILLTIPIVLSLGMGTPAQAECNRYRVWDSGRNSYVWRYDCDRSDRNYDDSYRDGYQKNRNNSYWLFRKNQDWHNNRDWRDRYRSKRDYPVDPSDWNYHRDWRYDMYRRDYERSRRYDKNRRDDDRNERYHKNPDFNIFLGF